MEIESIKAERVNLEANILQAEQAEYRKRRSEELLQLQLKLDALAAQKISTTSRKKNKGSRKGSRAKTINNKKNKIEDEHDDET